ncbi:hypothetical protein PYW08_001908 [Mythimna loreyi]|uniref:Uncharacterized protein n=3 Tax=Mythimna loreyi TaxID=667449 RepID=A0ACC2QZT4_9NEOP|nr:hypothetical protein PYW08_016469 [Mythimna loreyi]KAJ8728085.1 hypothetical protein PYW08_016470 [Mythimna loreyi]KAJ8730495.1 hypothetical protein PYW08_001908 [Mythimna loreyi]
MGAYCASVRKVDRSDHCYQCGKPGHKGAECCATLNCYACATVGKQADHHTGCRFCDPSVKAKGKVRRPTPAKSFAQDLLIADWVQVLSDSVTVISSAGAGTSSLEAITRERCCAAARFVDIAVVA